MGTCANIQAPGHPYEPTLAVSGIDNTIKIFSPDRRAQDDAQRGVNILNPDSSANMLSSHDTKEFGLCSAKRMHDSYRIISQNDHDRRGGISDDVITVGLGCISQRLRGPAN
jgi:DDB1- and CUL4-associated factor 6